MKQKNLIQKVISSPILHAILIYVSGAWIVLEITDFIVTNYGLNAKVRDILSIMLLCGLPVVVFLTWYAGRRKEETVQPYQQETPERSEKDHSGKNITIHALKRPRFIITTGIILLAIAITIIFRERHKARMTWARESLLPEIERIAEDGSWEGQENPVAFNLINKAQRYIPDDPLLIRLEEQIIGQFSLYTDPEGATVYYKPYSAIDSDWKILGTTPISGMRLPKGFSRIRIEKEDYRTVKDLLLITATDRPRWYKLPELVNLPEEMELISDTISRMGRIFIPGLEQIEFQHTGDFLMDRYEVTNEDFKKFMNEGGYQNPDYWKYPIIYERDTISWEVAMGLFVDKTGIQGPSTWEIGDYPDGQDRYPVSGVSWYEAAAYAEYTGKNLPTLYHWSIAAFTLASGVIVPLANFSNQGPVPVGSAQSMNRFGLFDLAGNVREWLFNENEGNDHRFIMGGGWNDQLYAFNDAYAQDPLDRSGTNGFRCIKYLDNGGIRNKLERSIKRPYRDFLNEPVVSDEIFSIFLNQYRYDTVNLKAVIEETIEKEEYIRQKITFEAAYGGERMMAYLFLPKTGSEPFQTIVYFPGSQTISNESSRQLQVNDMFVKSGRAVIYPIYKGTFERGDELASDYPDETNFYKEHVIMWMKDLSRSIDYLETREDIDASRLAYFGGSWGGAMGAIAPVVEKRIKTSILVVAGIYFQRCLPEVDPVNYLPRLKTPILMLNGRYDFFVPYETSQLPFYELLGTPEEDKRMRVYEKSHNVPGIQLTKETLAWLDKYLGPVHRLNR